MRLHFWGVNLYFSFWFFASVTASATISKGTLAMYLLLPAAIHECGHIIAMLCCGIKIDEIAFRAFGVEIKRGISTSYPKDIIACFGGIMANLLVAFALYLFAFKSLRIMLFLSVNVVVAIFNIMPIANLDGGQILRLLLERFGNPSAAFAVSQIFSLLLLIPIFAGAAFLVLRGSANISLIATCLYLAGIVIFQDKRYSKATLKIK